MNRILKKRLAAAIANLILLFAGTVTAAILGACGVVPDSPYGDSIDVLCIITLCFMAVILIVEMVAMLKISDSTRHTVYIAGATLGMCLFSTDFTNMLAGYGVSVNMQVFDCIDFVCFEAVTLALVYFWNYTYNVNFSVRTGRAALVAAAVAAGAYTGLTFANLQIIALVLWIAGLGAALARVYQRVYTDGSDNLPFYLTEAYLFAACGDCLADTLCGEKLIPFPPLGFNSFYAVAFILIFALIYVTYAMRTDRAALKASEYKLQYERVRTEALRGQIKPHFIFNSLAAIQSLYHKSTEDGDRATSLFSRHLRANIEAGNTDLIPFEKELDNIQVYAELENMRYEKKFNLIFDIDDADFEVPVLSLQPYIENAMRYSKVNEKADGYIKISSVRTAGGIMLQVSDNGVGFDVNVVPSSSYGIKNSKARFEILMGVEPEITSEAGKGTVVSIFIPAAEGGTNEDNYS